MIQGTDKVWYQQTPLSPKVPEAPGLAFRIARADSPNGPTVALLGAYRLGSPFMEYYGGQVVRAIRVVAIDMAGGQVYQSDLNGPGHPPIVLQASDKDVAEAGPGWSTESGFFNLDLPVLLALPQKGAGYRVFLWLDDLTSQVAEVQVPVNPRRGAGQACDRRALGGVRFGSDPGATEKTPDAIRLSLVRNGDGHVLQGTWNPVAMARPDQPVVWLLAASHRERRFAWSSLRGDEIPANQSPVVFQLDAKALLQDGGVEQKRFFIALSRSSATAVRVFQAR